MNKGILKKIVIATVVPGGYIALGAYGIYKLGKLIHKKIKGEPK